MSLYSQQDKSLFVSKYRLSKKNIMVPFFKISIHKLASVQRLPHSKIKSYFMRNGGGKNSLSEGAGFYDKCKKVFFQNSSHLKSENLVFFLAKGL